MRACIHRLCDFLGIAHHVHSEKIVAATCSATVGKNCKALSPTWYWADVPGPPELPAESSQSATVPNRIVAIGSFLSHEFSDEHSEFSAVTPPDTPAGEVLPPNTLEGESEASPFVVADVASPLESAVGDRISTTEVADGSYSTIHLAVQYPSGGPLRALLRAKADVHARDGHGVTALHVAALCGRADATTTLLAARATAHAASAEASQPLHIAAGSGCVEVLDLLLNARAAHTASPSSCWRQCYFGRNIVATWCRCCLEGCIWAHTYRYRDSE